jgi:hypothetical protein
VRTRRQSGVALITVMLILILISAMVVGMSWMVMTDGRLGGNNGNREAAFYGAEAGMEKLTADLGNQFATQGSVSAANLVTITSNYPVLTGITYQNALGNSTYLIECGSPLVSPCTPASTNSTVVSPSPYSGMNGLITTLTLSVAAQAANGSEVKLHRQVQLVSIPVFQFGIYSDSDLAFFNGPQFSFGGRVHTNGNLWLSPNSGPLLINDRVTVVGQVIRTNLENGWPGGSTITSTSQDYSGIVSISTTEGTATAATGPNYNNSPWVPLTLTESSDMGPSVYGAVSTAANSSPPTPWASVVSSYNGELQNGVAPLSLTSTSLGGITTPISLIRRPVSGETAAELSQQYFTEATLRILLDDYGSAGTCASSDMMSLTGIDTTSNPVDLATELSVVNGSGVGTAPSWWAANSSQTFLPLPVSGSAQTSGGTYQTYNLATGTTKGDGYWVPKNQAIMTGCIKIEYQDTSGNFHDITHKILGLGFTGRNINPQNTGASNYQAPPSLIPFGGVVTVNAQGPTVNGGVTTIPCGDPSPSSAAGTSSIIRIARVRDNPSTGASGNNYCGTLTGQQGYDYWPMALFDAREGSYRPGVALGGSPTKDGTSQIPAQGVMYYIELDAGDLAAWLKKNQSALSLNNNTGFSLYFSDRRNEQLDSTLSTPARTGSFGFNDVTNPSDGANGCPNGVLDGGPGGGEDLEGDGVFRNYGATPSTIHTPLINALSMTAVGSTTPNGAFMQNPNCSVKYTTLWPGATYVHTQEARENPAVFFRRALKIVDGATLALGTSCYGVSPNPPCGLTIASENPVYIQGDFNAPGGNANAAGTVATSVAADAVTLLSDNWNEVNAFSDPYSYTNSSAVQTSYRVAIIAGKGIPFPQPAGSPEDHGTDGGLHNFLRFLENWNPGTAISCIYEGSLVSFYYNRQAVGTYKGDSTTVYNPPNRVYNFDTNFTNGTQWLPPDTPNLRTINTVGFSEEILPTSDAN